MNLYRLHFIIIFCTLLFSSCKEKEPLPLPKEKQGSLTLIFSQTIDKQPVQFHQMSYTNTAGNSYQVNEIKYFISKLVLMSASGKPVEIKQNSGIHYVDNSISSTLQWRIAPIPAGEYVSLSFVFGLDENDNQSNRFVNPPESNFSWPEILGGGYHYMQINGKFLNKDGAIQNMNIHTGIGQIRNEENEITSFVHNHFKVNLPLKFVIEENKTVSLKLNMEIQRWFDTPNLYNFDEFGTGIMQNQRAQQLLKENGWNVFDLVIND